MMAAGSLATMSLFVFEDDDQLLSTLHRFHIDNVDDLLGVTDARLQEIRGELVRPTEAEGDEGEDDDEDEEGGQAEDPGVAAARDLAGRVSAFRRKVRDYVRQHEPELLALDATEAAERARREAEEAKRPEVLFRHVPAHVQRDCEKHSEERPSQYQQDWAADDLRCPICWALLWHPCSFPSGHACFPCLKMLFAGCDQDGRAVNPLTRSRMSAEEVQWDGSVERRIVRILNPRSPSPSTTGGLAKPTANSPVAATPSKHTTKGSLAFNVRAAVAAAAAAATASSAAPSKHPTAGSVASSSQTAVARTGASRGRALPRPQHRPLPTPRHGSGRRRRESGPV